MTTSELTVYAWVGEDEFGSGEIGLKQALVPAGLIPLVAIERASIDTPAIRAQLQAQVNRYGKPIRLVALGGSLAAPLTVLEPGLGPVPSEAAQRRAALAVVAWAREAADRGSGHNCGDWRTPEGRCALCGSAGSDHADD